MDLWLMFLALLGLAWRRVRLRVARACLDTASRLIDRGWPRLALPLVIVGGRLIPTFAPEVGA